MTKELMSESVSVKVICILGEISLHIGESRLDLSSLQAEELADLLEELADLLMEAVESAACPGDQDEESLQ